MKPSVDRPSAGDDETVRRSILDLLRARDAGARFMTELYAALGRAGIGAAEADRALAALEKSGVVMVRDHFCADPHLGGVDLRIAARVQSRAGADPQMSTIRAIDEAWNKWLNEYLANHRCG